MLGEGSTVAVVRQGVRRENGRPDTREPSSRLGRRLEKLVVCRRNQSQFLQYRCQHFPIQTMWPAATGPQLNQFTSGQPPFTLFNENAQSHPLQCRLNPCCPFVTLWIGVLGTSVRV